MTPRCTTLTPVLPVAAIEPVLPFWQALGFEVTVQVPHEDRIGFAILSNGSLELMYQTHASIDADVPAVAALVGDAPAMLFVQVADLDAVERAVGDRERLFPRRQTFYGATEIAVREPGGHIVTFAQFADTAAADG